MAERNRGTTSEPVEPVIIDSGDDSEPASTPNAGSVTIEFTPDDGNDNRDGGINARATPGSDGGSTEEGPPIPPQAGVRRRGRAGRIDDAGNALAGVISLVSALVAQRHGNVWLITEREASALGSATVKVLNHIPSTVIPAERLGLGLDLVGLAGAIGAVFGTRFVAYRQQKALGLDDAQMASLVNRARSEHAAQSPNGLPDDLQVSE